MDTALLENDKCRNLSKVAWCLDKGIMKKRAMGRWVDRVKRVTKLLQEINIQRKRKRNKVQNERLNRIKMLRISLVLDPKNEKVVEDLRREEEDERKWQVVEALHVRHTSRFHWAKEGDLPISFFFSFLKNRSKAPRILRMVNSRGDVLEGEDEVREEVSKHFRAFLSSNDNGASVEEYLENNIIFRISKEDREVLEREVEMEEIKRLVKKLVKKKSPGIDGIMNKLYQAYWDWIKEDMSMVIRDILKEGSMGEDLNKSLIVLLPKRSNPLSIGNFRPIFLLGGVYKAITKAIVNRICLLIPKLVHLI